MSNKSGTAPGAISLPTGGGALSGIGETFSPDLFTGTATFTVPLDLPPGRNGFQPDLSLSYSSGDGNGAFGLGWSVAVPTVSRKTSAGVPRYLDGDADQEDTFILAGAEDLVPVAEPRSGVTRFRPRTEGLFARIERLSEADRPVWKVSTRNGLVNTFGGGPDLAVVADPADPTRVFRWMLTGTVDPFGNRIDYEYMRDRGSDGPHEWDQLYLRRVCYVDYERGGGKVGYLVTVTFQYDERPDPFSEHRAGFEMRTRLRCRRIEIRTHADVDRLSHTYQLDYLDDLVEHGERATTELPLNAVSLLTRIRLVGHDADRTEELAPLQFDYTRFEPQQRRFQPLAADGNTLPAVSLADPELETVDLFGNGLPDIVQVNGAVQFWRNLGGGRFDRPRAMDDAPAGVSLADPGVQFADMNGDGRADLLTLPRRGYFPLTSGGRWSQERFVPYPTTPAVTTGGDDLRLVDLDGDGVVDALRTGTSFELFFNHPRRGWDRVETRPRRPAEQFPDVTFADPRVKLADLNGDGLQDIVLVEDGRIDYWPYLGHGNWGRRLTMAESPRFRDDPPLPSGFDPARVLFGDLDGDGLDDVVYVQAHRITCWINQGGERWSAPLQIAGTPAFVDIDGVRLVDLLGSGMAGVLWSTTPAADGASHYQFLDLSGGRKPYLLEQVDNHVGALTRLSHTPSTTFYLADESRPTMRWKAPLPFPVHVVTRVEVVDQISGSTLTSELAYHDGYWDGVDREFRGFGMVEQHDAEALTEEATAGWHVSPPRLTKTWFHQGPIGDGTEPVTERDHSAKYWSEDPPALGHVDAINAYLATLPSSARRTALRTLRGSVLRQEAYSPDGTTLELRPFTVTEHAYALREESLAGDGTGRRAPVFFPHPVAERVTHWDRGRDPMTSLEFVSDYDRYGQPGRKVSIGVPRRRDFRRRGPADEPYLATITTTRFARRDDASSYLVDRVATTTTSEIRDDGEASAFELRDAAEAGTAEATVIGQTLTYYDGEPFEGLPLGQLGDFGAPVRSESLALTESTLRQAYDPGDTGGPATPPYLEAGQTRWTEEYLAEFRAQLAPLAGYRFATEHGVERGFFAPTTRCRYDMHDSAGRRGLVIGVRDPLGQDMSIQYDRFDLLAVRSIDPVALMTEADHDYRVLKPRLITDVNGNRTELAYTPLGLVERVAVAGKPGEALGDTLDAPGVRYLYDLAPSPGPEGRRQPASVRTVRRVHHVNDHDVPLPDRHHTIELVEYSDGFGRLIQTRAQAEDTRFGDATFGTSTLPTDPDDPAVGSAVSGRRNHDHTRPNVLVSGWQVYDNKGRAVENYEPFLTSAWDYTPPSQHQLGRRVEIHYDQRDRVVRTVYPDGSHERSVYGIPVDLADTDSFEPTPWETYTYDRNDNADRTHPHLAHIHRHHRGTPTNVVVDALGRTVVSIQRNRATPADEIDALPPVEELRTETVHDIRGNIRHIVDALGRTAFRYRYDLADRMLRSESIDGGIQRTIVDAGGQEIERRDSKGALILQAYDLRGRESRMWARDDPFAAVTLRKHVEYGDGGDPRQPAADRSVARSVNTLGRLQRCFDEAGIHKVIRADFTGKELERIRHVLADDAILSVLPDPTDPDADRRSGAFRVNWTPPPATTIDEHASRLVEPVAYETTVRYDALGRTTSLRGPADTGGDRHEVRFGYNHAGDIERILLDGTPAVEHITYDASRRRTSVALGNGIMTRYAYDQQSGRLRRIRSERYSKPERDGHKYLPDGAPLHDVVHRHDLVGNIIETVERTPGCGISANPDAATITDPSLRGLVASGDALLRRFVYDPLYRLVSATGRECTSRQHTTPWQDGPRCGSGVTPNQHNAPALTTGYRQAFSYDRSGNLVRQAHTGRATRHLTMAQGSNRLADMQSGADRVSYRHDASGNVIHEGTSRHFDWDHSDQLKAYRTQASAAEPSVHTQYIYDAAGERLKKVVRRQGGDIAVTTYIDGVFEHHHRASPTGTATTHHTIMHVMDEDQRILMAREGTPHPDDQGPDVQYVLGDHLGNAITAVDDAGGFVNREEFTPYGETIFGGFARKRFRFNGRERDEESGLALHGARYYAAWLGRWMSCDPDDPGPFEVGASSPYCGFGCNPTNLTDPDGHAPTTPSSPTRAKIVIVQILRIILGDDPHHNPHPADATPIEPAGDSAEKQRKDAQRDDQQRRRGRERPGGMGDPPSREAPTPDPPESRRSRSTGKAGGRRSRRRERSRYHPSEAETRRRRLEARRRAPQPTTTLAGARQPSTSRLAPGARRAPALQTPRIRGVGALGPLATGWSAYLFATATTTEDQILAGADLAADFVGYAGPYGAAFSTGWDVGRTSDEAIGSISKKYLGKDLAPSTISADRWLSIDRALTAPRGWQTVGYRIAFWLDDL